MAGQLGTGQSFLFRPWTRPMALRTSQRRSKSDPIWFQLEQSSTELWKPPSSSCQRPWRWWLRLCVPSMHWRNGKSSTRHQSAILISCRNIRHHHEQQSRRQSGISSTPRRRRSQTSSFDRYHHHRLGTQRGTDASVGRWSERLPTRDP